MDWATFFKDYPAVITVVSGVVLAILGYIVGRWNTVENRQFSRRAAIHDMRIRESREYVDKWNNLIFIINDINSKVLMATSIKDISQVLDQESSIQLDLLLKDVQKQMDILHILNDEELLVWHNKFVPNLLPLIRYLHESINSNNQNNDFVIDKDKLMALSKLCTISVVAFARMKYRLDELAQTFK